MSSLSLNPGDKASALTQAVFGFLLLTLLLFGGPVYAESSAQSTETVVEEIAFDDAAAVSVEPIEPLSAEELGDLVGPIALYPDDLIAIVLPASTYPLQIVQASRFLARKKQVLENEVRKNDETLQPSEDWDDSVIALLNYPEVLELMNNDLDWTWKLGEAVLTQQEDVISAVGGFRERARLAGNLESDEHQTVEVVDDGSIEIMPADPEVIYVPYYEPSRVIVSHEYPVYHYYPRGYPVYYYPYPPDYAFSSGFFWGVTSAFSIGWSTHHLHQLHYGYAGHPYFGRRYYDYHYYRRPHLRLSRNYYYSYNERYRRPLYRHHEGNYWQPPARHRGVTPRDQNRHFPRPERRSSDRSDFDRHARQRNDRDGRSRGGSFDGESSQQRHFARSTPSVPGSRTQVITRGSNHGDSLPKVLTTRETSARQRMATAPRVPRSAIAPQPARQQIATRSARQQVPGKQSQTRARSEHRSESRSQPNHYAQRQRPQPKHQAQRQRPQPKHQAQPQRSRPEHQAQRQRSQPEHQAQRQRSQPKPKHQAHSRPERIASVSKPQRAAANRSNGRANSRERGYRVRP